jgi:hypothetical protein
MLTFTRISSIKEVDFTTLFQESLPEMEAGTYVWPETADTPDKKYLYLQDLISKLSPTGAFMYKVTENNKDLSLVIGKLLDGVLTTHFTFFGYNANGSKSWVYYDSTAEIRQAFYDSCGITKINFRYLNTGDLGSKTALVLGNKWSATPDIDTDAKINEAVSIKQFIATLN